jgi:MinD-like ATPase involved in chromosome partitioning or flagellar assembly
MRKILVSSVDRGACTGCVALALAGALADHGHRTLLIDSGHGAPLLHELLALPNAGGLGDVLRDPDRVRALQLGPQLYLLPVGTRVPSADELRGGAMREVLARCADAYDWLVLSGTTAEPDGATRTLLSLADGSVLVIGSASPFPAVDRASSLLGGSLCGTVVVGLPL